MEPGMNLWELLLDKRWEIGQKTLEHLWLTGISVLLAVIVGLVLGIVLSRTRKLATPVIGFANIIQTIPSLGLKPSSLKKRVYKFV